MKLEILLFCLVCLIILIIGVIKFLDFKKLSRQEQIKNLKEWLLRAVSLAEKELGNGTGALKLRAVYDMFLQRFPTLSLYISFETFSNYVDESLEKMKELISKNKAISGYIKEE